MIDMKIYMNGVAYIHKSSPANIQNSNKERIDRNRVRFEANTEPVILNLKRNYQGSDLLLERRYDFASPMEETAPNSNHEAIDTVDFIANEGKRSFSSVMRIPHQSKACFHLMVSVSKRRIAQAVNTASTRAEACKQKLLQDISGRGTQVEEACVS